MKKTRKILALVLALTMVFALAACSNNAEETEPAEDTTAAETVPEAEAEEGEATAEETTLTVWAWDPNFNIAIMNEAAARYNEEHPEVKVEVIEMAKADVEQKLHTTLAAQTTEGLPEIVLIEDYNAQKYIMSYPGCFADLTDKVDYSQFTANKVSVATVEGKTYSFPFDSGVAGMFYRTDILEEAGYTEDDLNNITWNEFVEIGKAVKEKTGKYMLGFDKTDGGLMRVMLQSAGAWYFEEDGTPNLTDNAALAEAMVMYKAIVDSDIAKPTSGWDEWVAAINSGDAATITTGVWIVGSVKGGEDQTGNWSVAPVPSLNDVEGATNASNLGGSSWYILEDSASKDVAIDFMNAIYANDVEFYQTILMNNGAVGTYAPAATGEAYMTPDEFFGGKAIYEDLAAWSNEIPSVNIGNYTYEADGAIMAQMEAYCAGDISLEDALAAAQAQLETQIG